MSAPTLTKPIVLEPAAQAFADAAAKPPLLYELTPEQARAVLDDVQAAPIEKLPVQETWFTVPASWATCACGCCGRSAPTTRCP